MFTFISTSFPSNILFPSSVKKFGRNSPEESLLLLEGGGAAAPFPLVSIVAELTSDDEATLSAFGGVGGAAPAISNSVGSGKLSR